LIPSRHSRVNAGREGAASDSGDAGSRDGAADSPRKEEAQHLVAAVRAAVAAPPSAGGDMSAMGGWGELLLAALWAAMAVQ